MDHNEAVRMLAAEKYLLGELPKTQRDEYEEHYFDCPACAEDLQTTVVFLESAKQVARQEARKAVDLFRTIAPAGAGLAGCDRPLRFPCWPFFCCSLAIRTALSSRT
jgi:hypothetical protein